MYKKELSVLIAMPPLKGSLFSKTLIIMAEYNKSGALGFILNLPTSTMVNESLKLMNIEYRHSDELPILFGGPVQTDFFWVLHASDFSCQSTIKIYQDMHLSSALDILPILDSEDCLEIFQVGVGYAGWGPEQLDREIQEGSWWLGTMDKSILLNTPYEERWNTAIQGLGVDPDHLHDYTDPTHPSIN